MSENVEKYYLFPNGLQPIDISRYLSGSGAQIVQYVARATRTDGKVKGEPIKDLEKAAWFLQDEIDRLKAEKPSATDYKAQVAAENADLPALAVSHGLKGDAQDAHEAGVELAEWHSARDERRVPNGFLLKGSFEWDKGNRGYDHQHLKQLAHSHFGWVYAQCNEYGEEGGTLSAPVRISYGGIQFPIKIVRQLTKKEN